MNVPNNTDNMFIEMLADPSIFDIASNQHVANIAIHAMANKFKNLFLSFFIVFKTEIVVIIYYIRSVYTSDPYQFLKLFLINIFMSR